MHSCKGECRLHTLDEHHGFIHSASYKDCFRSNFIRTERTSSKQVNKVEPVSTIDDVDVSTIVGSAFLREIISRKINVSAFVHA